MLRNLPDTGRCKPQVDTLTPTLTLHPHPDPKPDPSLARALAVSRAQVAMLHRLWLALILSCKLSGAEMRSELIRRLGCSRKELDARKELPRPHTRRTAATPCTSPSGYR